MSNVYRQIILIAIVFLLVSHATSAQVLSADHVVVIGIDGLSPVGIDKADTPTIDELIAQGASTMHARGVLPTSSSPNWASMISGAGPAQHGITDNAWMKPEHNIEPIATGNGFLFPTIFWVLRQQRPSAAIGVFHDWDGFGFLVEKDVPDTKVDADGPDQAVDLAIAFFKEKAPTLTFVHLDHVDHAGHTHGWGSDEYLKAVAHADALVAKTIDGLKAASIYDKTILLVTSDHGGKGKGHGGDTMEEIEIPWILSGPGVAKGKALIQFVNTYDTAATIAHILAVKPPDVWIAKPVLEAFAKE